MSEKPVLCDLDDVVFCLREPLEVALCAATGKNISHQNWYDFNCITDVYDIGIDEFYRILKDYRCIENALPEPGARAALKRLAATGRQIIMVTSRGWHDEGVRVTQEALNHHDIPHDQLIVVPKGRKKSDMYRELSPFFDCLIDDHVANLDDARESGIVDATYMITRPWNVKYTHHHRASDLAEVVDGLLGRTN